MPTADNHWILPSIHMRGGYFTLTRDIKLAAERKLRVDLAWLKHRKEERQGLPSITGSSDHYALLDVFHQCNSKDDGDLLRRIELVPELAGHINSQCAEQLFSGMRKNNYFLNT
ncbi:hypothetical protein KUCAC02_026441, partial [Chaenocephalus aceratus]